MQIFVRNLLTNDYRILTLEVESSDTVSSLMAQLEDKLGAPPVMQRIDCCTSMLRCDAAGTLADYRVQRHSVLTVACSPGSAHWYEHKVETLKRMGVEVVDGADADAGDKMQIFVRDCLVPCRRGRRVRTIVLEVEAGDTVASVKVQVQGKLGYPPALQCLYLYKKYETRPRPLDDSARTLADYGVREGSVLKLDMDDDGATAMIEALKIKESKSLPPVQQRKGSEETSPTTIDKTTVVREECALPRT